MNSVRIHGKPGLSCLQRMSKGWFFIDATIILITFTPQQFIVLKSDIKILITCKHIFMFTLLLYIKKLYNGQCLSQAQMIKNYSNYDINRLILFLCAMSFQDMDNYGSPKFPLPCSPYKLFSLC